MIPKILIVYVVVMATFIAVRAQSPAPTPKNIDEPASGSIDGKVVNESGQPLAGAALFVRAANSATSGRTTSTDSEGNFRVNGLERGLYVVSASSPAYTSAPSDAEFPTYYRIGDTVRLEMIRGGVLTGTVSNASGEPVIAVRVRATMVRDARGQTSKVPLGFQEAQTDDRGIYRIFGLRPGTYLVSAGGSSFSPSFNAFDTDIPTFAPSSTLDNAAEITVRSGEESSVDIRYRGEPGHTISGTAKASGTGSVSLTLTLPGSITPVATTIQFPGARGFALTGLPDGDYDLVASEATAPITSAMPSLAVSDPKRITIKGADVTGIELIPRPLLSLNGRITLEPSKIPECQGKRPPLFAETVVNLQRPDKLTDKDDPLTQRIFGGSATPDTSGAFVLRNVMPGRYRFEPRFYARYWYLQSITMNSAGVKPQKFDAAANWSTLRSGEQLPTLVITLAEGAASMRGRVPVAEGAALPTTVFLMPSEPEKANDVLRYFVSDIAADGTFGFSNVPPGKYFALAQSNADAQTATSAKLRQPEAAPARAKLRRTAETKKSEIELKPCQNLANYQLKP